MAGCEGELKCFVVGSPRSDGAWLKGNKSNTCKLESKFLFYPLTGFF